MIHRDSTQRSQSEGERDLREIREKLRDLEGSALAETVERCAVVVEKLTDMAERLQRPAVGVWVNHEQAAAHFGISKTALYKAVEEGAPRHRMVGNVYGYNLVELEEWFSSR